MKVVDLVRESLFEISSYPYGIAPPKRGVLARLGSNEGPQELPRKMINRLSEVLSQSNRYPSPSMEGLERKIAEYAGVNPESVIIGNGSTEVISALVSTFIKHREEAIISIPTFSAYEALVKLHQGEVKFVKMKENFEWDVDGILDSISPSTKIVFICRPNNPTGTMISKDDLKKIASRNVVVAVDEAYMEFSGDPVIDLIENDENIFIMRTFSKAFGLAGLRIGYGIANLELAKIMKRVVPPFPVNVVALKAAELVLDDRKFMEKTVKIVKEGRKYLFSELNKIKGVKVYPSQGNFLLMNIGRTGVKSGDLVKRLAERGVLIRNCAGFRGLTDEYVRVSIGLMRENRVFLRVFKEAIGN